MVVNSTELGSSLSFWGVNLSRADHWAAWMTNISGSCQHHFLVLSSTWSQIYFDESVGCKCFCHRFYYQLLEIKSLKKPRFGMLKVTASAIAQNFFVSKNVNLHWSSRVPIHKWDVFDRLFKRGNKIFCVCIYLVREDISFLLIENWIPMTEVFPGIPYYLQDILKVRRNILKPETNHSFVNWLYCNNWMKRSFHQC